MGETFLLKLFDGRLELWDRGGNVGQLDDVRVRLQGHFPKLGEVVWNLLLAGKEVWKLREHAACEGYDFA